LFLAEADETRAAKTMREVEAKANELRTQLREALESK
jgi:hypothetical protein